MRRLRAPLTAAAALLGLGMGLLVAGPVLAADGSPPTIYKWVDENGIAHYTTDKKRVPRNLRNRIRSLDEIKREQESAAPAPGGPSPGVAAATDVEEEGITGQPFREGELGTQADPEASPPPTRAGAGTATPPPAPAAVQAQPGQPARSPVGPPVRPAGGPPTGTDIYAVRDAGDEAGFGTNGRSGDSLFEPEPSAGESIDPNAAARRDELDGRIATLEAELAKDERRLKELISTARTEAGKPAPLYGVPELEELARRFPKIQAEIAALRAERRALDVPR